MTRGFITMAYGEKYCRLAEHLLMSYKLFGNCEYPFYVITDEMSRDRLAKVFDGVIVKDNFVKSTVDKLMFFTDNPFDESIFIDSDCSIVNDINFAFDEFEKNGSPISAIAGYEDIGNPEKGIQFGVNAIKEFKITKDFPNFNGGVYYYKKCERAKEFIAFMFDTLIANYNHYGMRVRDKGAFADEPPVVVSMLKFGFTPVPVEKKIMNIVWNKNRVKWNMRKKTCSFMWYEYNVHPTIIHWTVGGTETLDFEKYDVMVRGMYSNSSRLKLSFGKLLIFGKYRIYPQIQNVFPIVRKIVKNVKR